LNDHPIDKFDAEKVSFAFTLSELWETFLTQWDDEEEPMFSDFMAWIMLELEQVSDQLPESAA
jgi:hypothetical protein